MKVRVYKRSDGGISIIYPSVNSKLSEQEALDKCTPEGVQYVDMDSSDIPNDRSDREGWELDIDTKKIKVNKDSQRLKDYSRSKLILKRRASLLMEQAEDSLKKEGKIQ